MLERCDKCVRYVTLKLYRFIESEHIDCAWVCRRSNTLNPTEKKKFLNHPCFCDCREKKRETEKNNIFIVARVNLPTVGRNWGNVFINEQPMFWIYCYYGPWFKLFSSICFSPDSATEQKNMIIIIQSHSDKNYS